MLKRNREYIARTAQDVVAKHMELLQDQIQEAMTQALLEGHTELAAAYRDLRQQNSALRAAFTAAVGTDWNRIAKAAKAYMDRIRDPKPEAEASYAIRGLLDATEKTP